MDNKLTNREISVLNLMAQGLTTEAIAKNLGVFEKRVMYTDAICVR